MPAEVVNMESTDEFITNAQHELTAMVKDWKYDYGADDKACVAMLSWMILRLKLMPRLTLAPFEVQKSGGWKRCPPRL